jgi:hypothetical protein
MHWTASHLCGSDNIDYALVFHATASMLLALNFGTTGFLTSAQLLTAVHWCNHVLPQAALVLG